MSINVFATADVRCMFDYGYVSVYVCVHILITLSDYSERNSQTNLQLFSKQNIEIILFHKKLNQKLNIVQNALYKKLLYFNSSK